MKRAAGLKCTLAALLGFLAAAPSVLADETCALRRAASVDLTIDPVGRVTVPMTVAGRTLTMLVDTGGVLTLIDGHVAKDMKLDESIFRNGFFMMEFGGATIDHYVWAPDVNLGGLRNKKMQFAVLPLNDTTPGAEGVLSPDILRGFDVDFDFANGKLNLFSQDHCPGKVYYWSRDVSALAEIPISVDDDTGHIKIPIVVDGQKIQAILDTGAQRTTMSLEMMQGLFGIGHSDPLLKPLSEDQESMFRYPFKTATIGGITINNPDIVLVPDSLSADFHVAIIGMGVLRHLHLYIAYKEKMLYVTAATVH